MRTIVNLEDSQVKVLAEICNKENISRAEVIRQAVSMYIKQKMHQKSVVKKAFGIWKTRKIDGVKYQNQLRKEW